MSKPKEPCTQLTYEAPSWYPWISKTARGKLESVQNECLKVMTRMTYDSPSDFLRLEAGVESLEARIEKTNRLLWERYIRMEEKDPRRQLTTKVVKQRLKTRVGWRGKTTPLMRKQMNRETPKMTTNPLMKLKATMTAVELKKSKDQYTLPELAKEDRAENSRGRRRHRALHR